MKRSLKDIADLGGGGYRRISHFMVVSWLQHEQYTGEQKKVTNL